MPEISPVLAKYLVLKWIVMYPGDLELLNWCHYVKNSLGTVGRGPEFIVIKTAWNTCN